MKVVCPYCNNTAVFISSAVVYMGIDFGMIYLCRPCSAYVGVHRGTDKPLGTLANAELRSWRKRAHEAFDPLWKRKLMIRRAQRGPEYRQFWARNAGYHWLSSELGIPRDQCHIGLMNVEMCKRVIEICENVKRRKCEGKTVSNVIFDDVVK